MAAISLTQQVHTAQYVDTMSKNASLTLATQEAIDRKLEMRVGALEEAIMHIGTEQQGLKLKMALSCHDDYQWIWVTSLKVNETDYEWKKLKIIFQVFGTALTLAWIYGNLIIRYRPWNILDWILLLLEELMTFSTVSLISFLERTFCLLFSVMLLWVL